MEEDLRIPPPGHLQGLPGQPQQRHVHKCGRCPPEKKQMPQFANTMFGRQVVGHKEKEVESLERCIEAPIKITGLKVPRGAPPGTHMKTVQKVGHQQPGRLPGPVHFKLAYAPNDSFLYSGEHLYTVLTITLSEAMYGFTKVWTRIGGEGKITLKRTHARDGEVLRIVKKGMFNPNSAQVYGDIVVRIQVQIPAAGAPAVKKERENKKANLVRESEIDIKEDGSVWRHYVEAETAVSATSKQTARSKDEL